MNKDIITLKQIPRFSKRATFLKRKFRGSTFWSHLSLFPYYSCSFWVALACFGLLQFVIGCFGSLLLWQTTILKLLGHLLKSVSRFLHRKLQDFHIFDADNNVSFIFFLSFLHIAISEFVVGIISNIFMPSHF